MKVSKWVDFGQEVDVEITTDDIRGVLAECFDDVNRDRLGEDGPNQKDVVRAINLIGSFFTALTDENIAKLSDKQREIIGGFLAKHSVRFDSQVAELLK